MRVRTNCKDVLKTERQWNQNGYKLAENAAGEESGRSRGKKNE